MARRRNFPPREPIGDSSDPRGFEVLLARYLEWRDVRNYSQEGRATVEVCLRHFGRWCAERSIVRPGEVSREIVERYQRWLFHERSDGRRGLSVGTQRVRLIYLKGFYRWLAKERYVLYNPTSELDLPKAPIRLPVDGFSVDEIEQVIASVAVDTPVGLRDRALLEVLYSTGVRRAEVAALNVYDVDTARGWLTVRQGKGGKDRVVPIGERALAWVATYLEQGRPHLVADLDEMALFVNVEGGRMDREGLGHRVKKLIARSGVRERAGSCHLFRHTMATQMLEGGADVRYVQEMLGHSKLDTTQIYTHVSIAKLKAVHTATHPAARLGRKATSSAEEVAVTDLEL